MNGPWEPDDPRWDDGHATLATAPPTSAPPLAPPAPPPRRRWPWVAATVATLVVAGAVVGPRLGPRRGPSAGPADPQATAPPTTVAAPAEPTVRDAVDPPEHRFDVVTGVLAMGDGRRYRVGEPGDRLLVGDWDCDGRPTPALHRPSTGEVFLFTAWPDGTAVTSGPATATGLRHGEAVVRTDGDGCARVEVRSP